MGLEPSILFWISSRVAWIHASSGPKKSWAPFATAHCERWAFEKSQCRSSPTWNCGCFKKAKKSQKRWNTTTYCLSIRREDIIYEDSVITVLGFFNLKKKTCKLLILRSWRKNPLPLPPWQGWYVTCQRAWVTTIEASKKRCKFCDLCRAESEPLRGMAHDQKQGRLCVYLGIFTCQMYS